MKKTNNLIRSIKITSNSRNHIIPIIFIILFAIVGSVLLLGSKAAGPYASVEPEGGTLTGATSVTDNSASNNSYVKFGTESSGGGGGTTTSGCTNDDGTAVACSGGCKYNNIVAPCVGSATTGASGWGTTPSFDEEFNGSSVNSSVWNNEGGYCKNGMTVSTNNETQSGGQLTLTFDSDSNTCNGNYSTGYGGEISTNYALPVHGFAEARVAFPGNGTTIYNWPAWWTSGPGWPSSGEHDIMEGNGGASVNYHYGPQGSYGCNQGGSNGCQSGAWDISGTWSSANSSNPTFHTFGLYRGSNYADVYYDGNLVKSYATSDSGNGEVLILTNGCSGSCTNGTQMLVDYVRAWNANSNTNSSGDWTGSTACSNMGGCN